MENMEMLLEPMRASLRQVGEFLPHVLLAIAPSVAPAHWTIRATVESTRSGLLESSTSRLPAGVAFSSRSALGWSVKIRATVGAWLVQETTIRSTSQKYSEGTASNVTAHKPPAAGADLADLAR